MQLQSLSHLLFSSLVSPPLSFLSANVQALENALNMIGHQQRWLREMWPEPLVQGDPCLREEWL
jgi:hypothetical protein